MTYLKQFVDDKENWKFNKLKQNWILKNIKNIPKEYEEALILYLGTLQGGSRDRIIPELKEVISKWNTQYEEAERKIEEKLTKKVENEIDKDSKTSNDAENKEQKKKKKDAVDLEYALRCRAILSKLTDEDIEVKGQ